MKSLTDTLRLPHVDNFEFTEPDYRIRLDKLPSSGLRNSYNSQALPSVDAKLDVGANEKPIPMNKLQEALALREDTFKNFKAYKRLLNSIINDGKLELSSGSDNLTKLKCISQELRQTFNGLSSVSLGPTDVVNPSAQSNETTSSLQPKNLLHYDGLPAIDSSSSSLNSKNSFDYKSRYDSSSNRLHGDPSKSSRGLIAEANKLLQSDPDLATSSARAEIAACSFQSLDKGFCAAFQHAGSPSNSAIYNDHQAEKLRHRANWNSKKNRKCAFQDSFVRNANKTSQAPHSKDTNQQAEQ